MSDDGLTKMPWENALYAAVRQREDELAACHAEIAELRIVNSQLRAQLAKGRRWARHQSANWKLRQQAWRDERRQLLRELQNLSSSAKEKSLDPDPARGEERRL